MSEEKERSDRKGGFNYSKTIYLTNIVVFRHLPLGNGQFARGFGLFEPEHGRFRELPGGLQHGVGCVDSELGEGDEAE
jgi:hypothetical protein